jgi:glycosyltransferase involved in cell wall biosynthesis
MKILLVQDHLRNGGTERQSVLLANAFAAAGHATTLLTFRPGGALARPELVEGPAANSPPTVVTRHTLQPFDTRLNWFAPGLFGFVRRLAPDVILCMGRMANCYAGGLQKHLPQTAVIATMRTGKTLPRLYRRSLHLARHIAANSHDAARVLATDYAVPSAKISVIHNSLVFPPAPADVGGVPPPRNAAFRAAHGATEATTVLLCVAMFRPEKNHRFLVELVARLPRDADWQLWLAGEGETRPACERLTAELKLGARIKFLGFAADPAPLYRAADVAVLASLSESLPNFLIEAQAHGLPVVAGDVGGVRECFLPGETGWAVPPGDPDAFLAALSPLLAAPAHRAAIAPRARAFARENFSPTRQTAAYLELFSRLRSPN